MKIACVYHPRLHTGCGKFHFIADALRAIGQDVTHVQTMDELHNADRVCDLVLHEQRGPASLCLADFRRFLPHREALHFQWYADLNVFDDELALEKQAPIEPFLEIMRGMDMVFVKEKDRLLDYRDIGVNAVWMDQGCPSAMRQAELKENPEFDVILWGSASRPLWKQRWEDVQTLVRAGFKVAWATGDGNLPPGVHHLSGCQPLELPGLIERAKIALVVDARQDIEGYWSDRIWLAAGAGACCVRRHSIGSGHLPAFQYESDAVLVRIVEELCGDYRKRLANGAMARERTMRVHTYENRCQEIIGHAESLLAKRCRQPHLQAV